MKLFFQRNDLERAARLALLHRQAGVSETLAVDTAVSDVADEALPFYSEEEVRQLLQYVLGKDDVDEAFHDALYAIRKL